MQKQRFNRQHLSECQRNGHRLKSTLALGERLCMRCGKKAYCPACTSRIPQGATLIYCLDRFHV